MSQPYAHQRGREGEAAARQFLEQQGWDFVAANWACRAGEIDLIMQDGEIRVFVEVRTRRAATRFGGGAETVGWQKQRKLVRAAQWYRQQEDYWGDARFDVVEVRYLAPGRYGVSHIPHAFEVDY